jgi:hypothetical protein
MSDDYIEAPTAGTEEVIVPAPCAITVFVGAITAAGVADVEPRLVVGWNGQGSPIVLGPDGALRLLDPGDAVTDVAWDGAP